VELKVPPAELIKINPDRWTAPFWAAAENHQLVCARCRSCGRFRMPPGPFCPQCRSQEVDWPELSGHGNVFTYTVVAHPVLAGLKDCVPYAVAVVTLNDAGGVRLLGNVVEMDSDQLEVGLPVAVKWSPGLVPSEARNPPSPADGILDGRSEVCGPWRPRGCGTGSPDG
jgi:hypothetical protein